jgi:hypothetical protein
MRVSAKHGGFAPPEARLPVAIIGGILLPIGLFWFAWTAAPVSIPWIVSVIATIPFGIGMVLVFLSVLVCVLTFRATMSVNSLFLVTQVYLVDSYLIYSASVLAANSVLRSLFGAAFPLFTTQMYQRLGINWASTLVAFLALACAPLPFLFYRVCPLSPKLSVSFLTLLQYGEKIRTRSKYAKEAAAMAAMLKERALKQSELENQGRPATESA